MPGLAVLTLSNVEAVNEVLEAIGQQPVSSATYSAAVSGTWPALTYDSSIVAQVKRIMERVTIDVLKTGFRFNTTAAKTYTAAAGVVDISALESDLNVIRVIPAGSNEYDAFEMRGDGKLVMLSTGLTTGFSGNYQMKVVYGLEVSKCPPDIQRIIVSRTIAYMMETRMNDPQRRQFAKEQEAKSDLEAARPMRTPANTPINAAPIMPQMPNAGG